MGAPGHDIFAARPGGPAESIGRSFGAQRPLLAGMIVWAVALLVLGAAIVGLGLLLSEILLPAGLGDADASWSRWFVPERTQTLNDVTRVWSELGATPVILAICAVVGVVLAIGRRWRQLAFLACAMTLEFVVFLTTTMIVGRHRPSVPQLDAAPPTSSFPSGHTAAALTLYLGLAVVLGSLIRGTWARALVWVVALLVPILVAVSRVYRGMHFPTDVTASALLSVGALVFALLAVRTMTAARAERARRAAPAQPAETRPEVTS